MNYKEAAIELGRIISFLEKVGGYSEFEDDLYSLLDALNEDAAKVIEPPDLEVV